MEIVPIFVQKLFAFLYDHETDNEYDRCIELWTDPSYLYEYAKENIKDADLTNYVSDRLEDSEQIIDLIEELSTNDSKLLEELFRPLSDNEQSIVQLSLQKGKTRHRYRKNDLRFYAIRIDENCFVITGGAIKASQSMQDNEHTKNELVKLKRCKEYLKSNGVFDNDSFYELLMEQNDQ